MPDPGSAAPLVSAGRRQLIIDQLCTHFAYDHLSEGELERRLDAAHAAANAEELALLIAGLPALPAEAGGVLDELERAPTGTVRDQQIVAAVMGGTERKGAWTPAKQVVAIAVMGGVVLDFREARFGPSETAVDVLALMGSVEILVPPGLRVEASGIGIMGGFDSSEATGHDLGPGAPLLRINGLALMGGVEVSERRPGESAREAKLRRRQRRRELRSG